MSFRSAPIIEQPVNKFGDGRLSNGASEFHYKIDRVHWLPLFKHCRESASRLGNLFNKRIYWLHERKFFEKSAVPLIFNQFADQRFQSVSRFKSEINHTLSYIFYCIYTFLESLKLLQITSRLVPMSEKTAIHIDVWFSAVKIRNVPLMKSAR